MFADRLTYNLVILFTNNLFSFFLGNPSGSRYSRRSGACRSSGKMGGRGNRVAARNGNTFPTTFNFGPLLIKCPEQGCSKHVCREKARTQAEKINGFT